MAIEFRLPELGENIVSGTVSKVLIKVGDTVAVDQAVVELETDKAVVEIPSTISGTVSEVRAAVGKSLAVGDVIFVVSGSTDAQQQRPAPPPEPPKPAPPKAAPAPPPPPPPVERPAPTIPVAGRTALAAPSVRRLARELGVEVDAVPGSGPGGRVSAEDVRAFASGGVTTSSAPPEPPAAHPSESGRAGGVERVAMSTIRRKTAAHMTTSWQTIPHVTHFDCADITTLEAFRKQYGKQVEAAGGRLTATTILVKILAAALRKFPKFNASVDMENQEIVFKDAVNIGVAVDTENGLLVPVVKNADTKSLVALSTEIVQLAEKARSRKLTLDEMQGGTFTVTNLGGLGGKNFTPIINAPEVAILGMSRSRVEPVFSNGAFAPRMMLPLALSYDHRVIDGADAARFLRWVAEAIEQPMVMWLEES